MRLIDADAIKYGECMTRACNGKYNCQECSIAIVRKEEIDNTPTVEPFERIGSICNENCGVQRPTGEWEDYSPTFYRCPECGYLLEKDCPQCGNKIVIHRENNKSEYSALRAENRRLTGELEQVYERLNDLTEKIKNIEEKHNIKPTNVENLRENDIN